jgi:hypothetical protein
MPPAELLVVHPRNSQTAELIEFKQVFHHPD